MEIAIFIIIGIIVLFAIVMTIRNELTYAFLSSLNHFLHDELTRILCTYKDKEISFTELEEQKFNYFSEKVTNILDKLSYNKIVFSYKPIKLKYWLSKEDIDFIKELTQYKKSA